MRLLPRPVQEQLRVFVVASRDPFGNGGRTALNCKLLSVQEQLPPPDFSLSECKQCVRNSAPFGRRYGGNERVTVVRIAVFAAEPPELRFFKGRFSFNRFLPAGRERYALFRKHEKLRLPIAHLGIQHRLGRGIPVVDQRGPHDDLPPGQQGADIDILRANRRPGEQLHITRDPQRISVRFGHGIQIVRLELVITRHVTRLPHRHLLRRSDENVQVVLLPRNRKRRHIELERNEPTAVTTRETAVHEHIGTHHDFVEFQEQPFAVPAGRNCERGPEPRLANRGRTPVSACRTAEFLVGDIRHIVESERRIIRNRNVDPLIRQHIRPARRELPDAGKQ